MAQSPPYLGLYLIVRNSERTIGRLLNSVLVRLPEDGPHARAGEPAFDELVIVDTGSTDGTAGAVRDAILRAGYPERDFRAPPFRVTPAPGSDNPICWSSRARRDGLPYLVFASYRCPVAAAQGWDHIGDFAAARNACFELGTARWRGYLDADDVFPGAARLKPTLRSSEESAPGANAVVLPYAYDPVTTQAKLRWVRWEDPACGGWEWRGAIHEGLVPRTAMRIKRLVYPDLIVEHDWSAGGDRGERNARIARVTYESDPDPQERLRMAFYLGWEAREKGRADEARKLLGEATEHEHGFGLKASVLLGQLEADAGRFPAAVRVVGGGVATSPEDPLGWACLAEIYARSGQHQRAVDAWERCVSAREALPDLEWEDAATLDATAPLRVAESLVALRRLGEARQLVEAVPGHLRYGPTPIVHLWARVNRLVLRETAVEHLCQAASAHLWQWDAQGAVELLANAPQPVRDHPRLGRYRRAILARLYHLEGWDAYRRAYEALPPDPDDPERDAGQLTLGRARAAIEWAKAQAAKGEPLHVLSVGCWSARIEAAVMAANERIVLTVADPSTEGGKGIAELVERFGEERVRRHHMRGVTDWVPLFEAFDLVICFEVLEHVPDPAVALSRLASALSDNGTLLLSTPKGSHWIEPFQSDPAQLRDPFYGHVRAYEARGLLEEMRHAGLEPDITATEPYGRVLLARARLSTRRVDRDAIDIAILAGAPAPFDPDSLLEGHLGGSEEAVVHLAEALARRSDIRRVTVYAPRPERDAEVHVRAGVLWADLEDFDPGAQRHDAVLLWRCPHALAELEIRDAPYARLLWLHDTHYGAPAELYEHADAVIVLSQAHARAVRDGDGYAGPCVSCRNGLDLAAFPPLTEADEERRDPNRVIYASSPDRGLVRLLAAWPEVRDRVPNATLDIYYSWDGLERRIAEDAEFRAKHGYWFAKLKRDVEELAPLGVTYHGGVSHPELHAAYRESGVWAYPTSFFEISCISAMKAQAAGCWPVATGAGALPETLGPWGDRFDDDAELDTPGGLVAFAELVALRLDGFGSCPPAPSLRRKMSDEARARFGWDGAAEGFAVAARGAVARRLEDLADAAQAREAIEAGEFESLEQVLSELEGS